MKSKTRSLMLSLTILTVLALSAFWTVPAFADDSTPPPTETPTVVTPPADEVTELAPSMEESAPTEVAPPVDEEALTAVPVVEETAPLQESVAETLAQIPDGTDVVVVNDQGETVPLASQEAADLINTNDPIWCPTGVAPIPGMGGCTATQATFNGGLLNLLTGKTVAGTIWILGSYNSMTAGESGEIIVDGGALGTTANFALTVKGGWTGATAGTINTANPSEFNVAFTILGWNADVTLSDLLITGASGSGYALKVLTTKNINVTNVDVQTNTTYYGGAYLDNTMGSGNIKVHDSTFNGNTGSIASDGLDMGSLGTISIKNVSANGNTRYGAYINNYSSAITAKPVTLTGSNNFTFNGDTGLTILSLGAITVSNITAIYNGGSGAELNNCFYDYYNQYCINYAVSAVTLKGANNFSNNGWDGLRVWSNGAITLYNTTANNNGTDAARPGATDPTDPAYTGQNDGTGKGVYLYNWAYPGKGITLFGTNTFNGNAETGLYMRSYGLVTLNNITANDNGQSCNSPSAICDGIHLRTSKGFTLLGYGIFNGNGDDGMETHTIGVVTLNNLYAGSNGSWGVITDSFGPASVVNMLGTNTFVDNVDQGLTVWSEGAVLLSNLTASGNGAGGVYVDNAWKYDYLLDDWVLAAKPVTLSGTNTFNGNTATGLEVHSSGIITTNAVTALSNGQGIYLENCLYDAGPDDCTGLPGKAVTMNGANNVNSNSGDGLYIESLGAIKVNNLTATDNGGNGAILDNNWTAAIGGVTITGFANTSSNGLRGMGIYSHGAVLTYNLTANSNGPDSALSTQNFYRGVSIYNAADPLKPMNVTLLGINQFNDNWNTGLQIASCGIILLNNVTANNNGEPYDLTNNPAPVGGGVKIDNSFSSIAKAVTLNGINTFNGNLDDGLFVTSKGAILVNKVRASGNGSTGAYLFNQYNASSMPVTILGYGVFNDNQLGGLNIYSNGAVITNMLTANDNTGGTAGMGVYIDNKNNLLTTSFVSVTMNGINTFNGNADDGLYVYSDGVITINNVTANDNGGDGAYLDNMFYASVLKNIIVNGSNTFVNNGMSGLEFVASGAVTMTRIISDLNNEGITGTALTSITLTCGSLTFNTGAGYNLTSGALITLKGLFAYGNGAPNGGVAVITRTCPLL